MQNSNRGNPSRGRGYNNRGSRGRGRGNRGYSNRGFTYTGRSNENDAPRGYSNRNNEHGDMKTGLFKDSFLEDPWKELIYGKKSKPSIVIQPSQVPTTKADEDVSDDEGEIILSDEEEESKESAAIIGLGEGIVEAAREVS